MTVSPGSNMCEGLWFLMFANIRSLEGETETEFQSLIVCHHMTGEQ